MIIYIISFTDKGHELSKRIAALTDEKSNIDVKIFFKGDIEENIFKWTENAFSRCNAIVFIGALGIAVRAVSDFIRGKDKDPAVIVCDELGKFVIPVLSGHMGGANELAEEIAKKINAVPVITTATDINGLWAVDTWALRNGLKINNIQNIKYISSAVLRGEKIGFKSDVNMNFDIPRDLIAKEYAECGIVISPYIKKAFKHTLNLIPKCISIGVGSRKNVQENELVNLFKRVMKDNNIDEYAANEVSTVDIKKNEKSVLMLCRHIGVDLKCYSAEELNDLDGVFSGSEFVSKTVGTDCVCERCCAKSGGKIIVRKTKGNGVTMAVALKGGALQ